MVFICLFGGHGFDPVYISAQLAGGGLMLGAFFMATDYVTSPITDKGKYIYGIFLGVMTEFSGATDLRQRAYPMPLFLAIFWFR